MTGENDVRRRLMGRRIATRRHELEMSQYKVAKLTGVTQPAVDAWEHGNRVPRWEELRALGRALSVDPHDIIDPLVSDLRDVGDDGGEGG